MYGSGKALSLKDRILARKLEKYFIDKHKNTTFFGGEVGVNIKDLYPVICTKEGMKMFKTKDTIKQLKGFYHKDISYVRKRKSNKA